MKRIKELGVRPELEVFELGYIELSKRLIGEGLIDVPVLFQICLGIAYGAPATPQAMRAMLEQLPEGSHWSGFAIGKMEMPMVAQAMLFGGQSPRSASRTASTFLEGARLERRSCLACKGGRGEPGRAARQYSRGSGPSAVLNRPPRVP